MDTSNKIVNQLSHVGSYMMDHQLVWGNAGNISAKVSDDAFLITASGTSIGELSEDDFVNCFTDGRNNLTDKKPSKEVPMHAAVYEERPEIQAVLHASPFFSTLVACSDLEIPSDLFVESMYYLEKVDRVGYHHPGSNRLGQAVREKAAEANILLLENHGVLVYDTSIKEARMALETLEYTCRMMLTAMGASVNMKHLSGEAVTDFLDNSGYKPRRRWGKP
ncbi:class II aldolase/adducin family protein [Virgibacillus siamensis]|uniref:class II aldolase/adducin family protein n=1 Tax=Virgibacillus siamensis TaxID=480071 RepID=UPI0009860709|nr:class II aldolase/adducin family protein [Virgibacillus siamensis]